MSATYLGHSTGKGSQPVVVKIPLGDQEIVERFRSEIRMLSELKHPSIVRVLGSGEADLAFRESDGTERVRSVPWMAMAHAGTRSLRQRLRPPLGGPLPWGEVRALLEQILDALAYLHARGLVHRDIKPDNIIQGDDGRWVLLDFGVAKESRPAPQANRAPAATLVGGIIGTIDYMAPEQRDGEDVDGRADIYALGVTAWEALLGHAPVLGESLPSVELGEERVPADVDVLISRMIARDPARRYPDPLQAKEALKVGATRVEASRKRRRMLRRRGSLLGALLVAGGVAGGVWWVGNLVARQEVVRIMAEFKGTPGVRQADETTAALSAMLKRNRYWGRREALAALADSDLRARYETDHADMVRKGAEIVGMLAAGSDRGKEGLLLAESFEAEYKGRYGASDEVAGRKGPDPDFQLVADKRRQALDREACERGAIEIDRLFGEGSCEQAVKRADTLVAAMTTPEGQGRAREKRDAIALAWKRQVVERVARDVNKTDATSIRDAESRLARVKAITGLPMASVEREYDDALWAACKSSAEAMLGENRFAAARDAARRFEQYSAFKVPEFFGQCGAFLEGVDRAEESWDFASARVEARRTADDTKLVDLEAIARAVEGLRRARTKWPASASNKESLALEELLAQKFYESARTPSQPSRIRENADAFAALFPQDRSRSEKIRNRICARAREIATGEVGALGTVTKGTMNNRATNARAVVDLISADPLLSQQARSYIAVLSDSAANAITSGGDEQAWCAFQYVAQRMPAGAMLRDEEPTVFHVLVNRVTVQMSSADYDQLKGWMLGADAEPRVTVSLDGAGASASFAANGELNKPAFAVTATPEGRAFEFYLDTRRVGGIVVTVSDRDTYGVKLKPLVARFARDRLEKGGTQTIDAGNSSRIEMAWQWD